MDAPSKVITHIQGEKYANNPRQITRKQFERLRADLAELGDLSGVVHDLNSNQFIGGNQRSEAFSINDCEIELIEQYAQPDKQGTVAHGFIVWQGGRYAYRQVRWTEQQCRAANIKANIDGGSWDADIIASWPVDELQEYGWNTDTLKDWQGDVTALNAFIESNKPPVPEAPDAEIGRADELRQKWGVELGQLWIIPSKSGPGEHRLICGDCMNRAVVEKVMQNDLPTCLFTDPPYGVSIGAKNRFLNSFQPAGRNLDNIESDDDNKDDLREMLLSAFKLAKEIIADDCSVFVCAPQGGSLGLMMMMMMMMDAGLEVRHVLNWVKNQPTFSLGRLDYEYQHEPILFTWKKTHKRTKGGQFHTSVWNVDKPRASVDHPTMKPVELPRNAIANHTDPGDSVYEPFCGSGTTIVACEQLARQCRAIEIAPQYVAVSLERLAAMGLEPRRTE